MHTGGGTLITVVVISAGLFSDAGITTAINSGAARTSAANCGGASDDLRGFRTSSGVLTTGYQMMSYETLAACLPLSPSLGPHADGPRTHIKTRRTRRGLPLIRAAGLRGRPSFIDIPSSELHDVIGEAAALRANCSSPKASPYGGCVSRCVHQCFLVRGVRLYATHVKQVLSLT